MTRRDVGDLAVLAWAAIMLVIIGLAWFGVIE